MRNSKFVKYCILFFYFASFTSLLSLAQNYQPVNSGRTALFYDSVYNVYSLKMDSVKIVGEDSIHFPFQIFQSVNLGSYDRANIIDGSWIGKEIVQNNPGWTIFHNKSMDSCFIKTNAELHEQWVSFSIYDSLTIVSEVISFDTCTFLGLTDSVKRISFTCYDRNMNLLNCSLNNLQIVLSKNYGLIKTLNFYHFPGLVAITYYNKQVIELDLAGLTNPNAGIKNIEWDDIYNMQIGDEIHWRSYNENNFKEYSSSEYLYIDKYIGRQDLEDTIEFTINRHRHYVGQFGYTSSTIEFTTILDTTYTLLWKCIYDSTLRHIHGQPVIRYNQYHLPHKGSFWSMKNGMVMKKSVIGDCRVMVFESETGYWHVPLDFYYCSDIIYFEGLGGPYYYTSNSDGESRRDLIYFKKENLEWGTPYIFSKSVLPSETREIFVFPNPANEKITVKIANIMVKASDLSITDIAGRRLLSIQLNSESNEINIENLSSGIYLYNIVSKYGVIKSGKLIIE